MFRPSETILAAGSRRSFLRRSAMAAAAPGLVLASAATGRAASKIPRNGRIGDYFAEVGADEAAHVEILQALLDDEDNHLTPKVRAMPTLRNLTQRSYAAFVEAAAAFENTGTGVYSGALFATEQTEEYFPTAAGLATVEARHASFLNFLLGEPLVPDFAPVDSPIDQTVTLSRVAPFIAKLNGSKPSFNPTTASEDNNFAILDFLLLLEYVEAAFYAANVAKFF